MAYDLEWERWATEEVRLLRDPDRRELTPEIIRSLLEKARPGAEELRKSRERVMPPIPRFVPRK